MFRVVSLIVLLVAAAGSASAAKTIEYLEGAYVLLLSGVELPTGVAGTLSFKSCADCQRITLQVSSATEYSVLGGGALTLSDFSTQVAQLRQTDAGNDSRVGVFYSLATKRVTRVVLTPATN